MDKVMKIAKFSASIHPLRSWCACFSAARHKSNELLRLRASATIACIHYIWHARNQRVFEVIVVTEEACEEQTVNTLRYRWLDTGLEKNRRTQGIGGREIQKGKRDDSNRLSNQVLRL